MTPEEIKAQADAEALAKEKKEAGEKALLQDPIKLELKKQEEKKSYSDKEKALFNLRKHAEKAKELGIDPTEVFGGEEQPSDEVPEWYKKEQAKQAQKTALELAEGITDEDVRNLTKEYLSTRIIPSGNPQDDFRLAYSAVNALKNKQILEEVQRKTNPRTVAAGGSQSVKTDDIFEPTDAEKYMMTTFKISKEKILEARQKTAARAQGM